MDKEKIKEQLIEELGPMYDLVNTVIYLHQEEDEELESDKEKFDSIVLLQAEKLFEIVKSQLKTVEAWDEEDIVRVWLEAVFQCLIISIDRLIHPEDKKMVIERTINKLKNVNNF